MRDRFDILTQWLMVLLAVVVMCGVFGCWMLFRAWWRRQFFERRRPVKNSSPPADLWHLSGERLVSEIDRAEQEQSDDYDDFGFNDEDPLHDR